MTAPPGRRSALGGGSESAPGSSGGDTPTLTQPDDVVPLRHGLSAIYVRDADPLAIAVRRFRRGRPLNAEQTQAYQSWLAEQRQEAAS